MSKISWSIQEIWNKQIVPAQRPPKTRDYISASDIGNPFIDRYYKMNGETPTNPYDERTLRIFDAGKSWERMMTMVFKMAGILMDEQGWIEVPANEHHLKVIGKLDCVLGGQPNLEQAKDSINQFISMYNLKIEEEFILERAYKLIQLLEEKYPKGLTPIVAEIKTVNSMSFWAHKNLGADGYFKGYDHHKLQLLTYLLGHPKIKEGRLFYISKDDLCLQETGVFIDETLQKKWKDDVIQMSNYIKNNVCPPREDDVVWNQDKQSYEVNWRIGRSSFLTKITGLSKEQWEEKAGAVARTKNLTTKWLNQAKSLGIDATGLSIEAVKKECMRLNRLAKKAQAQVAVT